MGNTQSIDKYQKISKWIFIGLSILGFLFDIIGIIFPPIAPLTFGFTAVVAGLSIMNESALLMSKALNLELDAKQVISSSISIAGSLLSFIPGAGVFTASAKPATNLAKLSVQSIKEAGSRVIGSYIRSIPVIPNSFMKLLNPVGAQLANIDRAVNVAYGLTRPAFEALGTAKTITNLGLIVADKAKTVGFKIYDKYKENENKNKINYSDVNTPNKQKVINEVKQTFSPTVNSFNSFIKATQNYRFQDRHFRNNKMNLLNFLMEEYDAVNNILLEFIH
jgi:hypothetical protein